MSANQKKPGLAQFSPAIAWFIISLILLLLPADELPETDSFLEAIYPDKWIHAGVFGLMTLLFVWPVGKADFPYQKKSTIFVRIVLGVCAWGLITEFLQKFLVAGRSFELSDWGADILGSIIAFIIAKKYFLRRK